MLFVGDDWAEDHHDVEVVDDQGNRLAHRPSLCTHTGNHEDYPRLNALPADETGLARLTDHVAVLPRGHWWTMVGKTFASLGGAPSVDYLHRIPGKTWFPDEAITDDDIARAVAVGPAEIMLTHDTPAPSTPTVERIIAGDHRWKWIKESLDYAAAGRDPDHPGFRDRPTSDQRVWFGGAERIRTPDLL